MLTNDVLRSLRYILSANDVRMAEITTLAGYSASAAQLEAYLKSEDDPGYQSCPDELLAHFLDGLVILKRGRDESRPTPPVELPVSNNTVLKKLRVAYELKDDDVRTILASVGFDISKAELNALFRKPDQGNYRVCGDQLLRNFLKGLATRKQPRKEPGAQRQSAPGKK